MTWRPITKEKCWCQESHPMGSACGCWTCDECGRFYPCQIQDITEIKFWFISPIDGKWIDSKDWKLPEYII